ncbi:MAG: hypothetical protein EA360_11045 [Balneolaceae bacterium]|nr:MAG: hypothetical protein EA360_11045 [Balneolaceae bacterium]
MRKEGYITGCFKTGMILLSVSLLPLCLSAQEINFGTFGTYTLELNQVTLDDLEFQGPINPNSGIHEVELTDSKVLQILGVKYLDVGVLISGDGELLLDGDINNASDPTRKIPFTLFAAYSNKGDGNNLPGDSVTIPLSTNQGTARFPILQRQFAPPGPPPPPPTNAFQMSQVQETAELYLYGQIDVGNVVAGTYSGTITITIEYDAPPTPSP